MVYTVELTKLCTYIIKLNVIQVAQGKSVVWVYIRIKFILLLDFRCFL